MGRIKITFTQDSFRDFATFMTEAEDDVTVDLIVTKAQNDKAFVKG
jgi:hypothetical protein